jgi:hypothetical protein
MEKAYTEKASLRLFEELDESMQDLNPTGQLSLIHGTNNPVSVIEYQSTVSCKKPHVTQDAKYDFSANASPISQKKQEAVP